jgi:hypothetical protein
VTPEIREQVRLYRARTRARMIASKLTRANPVGPRHDEVNGQVPEQRGGHNPNSSVGPEVQQWQPAIHGEWVATGYGNERFIPDADWQPRVTETQEREPSVPEIKIQQYAPPAPQPHPDGRYRDPHACGPVGQPWVDPNERKQ